MEHALELQAGTRQATAHHCSMTQGVPFRVGERAHLGLGLLPGALEHLGLLLGNLKHVAVVVHHRCCGRGGVVEDLGHVKLQASAQAGRDADADVRVAHQVVVQRREQDRARVQEVHRAQHLDLRMAQDTHAARSASEHSGAWRHSLLGPGLCCRSRLCSPMHYLGHLALPSPCTTSIGHWLLLAAGSCRSRAAPDPISMPPFPPS